MSDKTPELAGAVEEFAKQVQDIVGDKLAKPPTADTFRQRVVVWLFRCLLGLIGLSIVPAGTGAWSYGNKRAEISSELQKKRTDARLRQRDLQLKLLERIIDVAKGADFNDPTSLYRLGLIAHMVNENTDVFGLQLVEAESTMNKLFSRLAPLSGLRRRIAESGLLISTLAGQSKSLQTTIKGADHSMAALRKLLQDPMLPKWQRKKLSDEYDEKERLLSTSQMKEEFYSQQLVREQSLLKYFQLELTHQSDVLKEMLQDVVALRDSLRTKSQEFRRLLDALYRTDLVGKTLYRETSDTLDALDKDYQVAVSTIDRLTEDLAGERDQLKLVREAYTQCKKQLETCTVEKQKDDKTNTKIPDDELDVVLVPIAPSTAPVPRKAPVPKKGTDAVPKPRDTSSMAPDPPRPASTIPSPAKGIVTKQRSPVQRVQRKARPVLQGLF